jgi:hypothetical protein
MRYISLKAASKPLRVRLSQEPHRVDISIGCNDQVVTVGLYELKAAIDEMAKAEQAAFNVDMEAAIRAALEGEA